jgi:hypothetical protein
LRTGGKTKEILRRESAAMLARTIQVRWVADLGSPEAPEKFICHGVQVDVRPDKFKAAQAKLAEGATDLLYSAILVDSGAEPYYILGGYRLID